MENKTYETLKNIVSELETTKQVLRGRAEELSQVCGNISDKVFEKYDPKERDAYHEILQFNEAYDRFNLAMYSTAETFVNVAKDAHTGYMAWKDVLEENGLVFRKHKPAGKSLLESIVSGLFGLARMSAGVGGYAIATNDGQSVRLVQKKRERKN